MGLDKQDNTSMRVSFVRRTLLDDATTRCSRTLGHSAAAPRTTCACWCSPTSGCSAHLACVFAAPGLARNGIRLGRPPLQRSSGLVVLELLPMDSLGRVLALPAALRQGALRALRGQPQSQVREAMLEMRRGFRAADDDSLLHRRPGGYSLSRLARLEVGARRSPCSAHRLRRRIRAPQETECRPLKLLYYLY